MPILLPTTSLPTTPADFQAIVSNQIKKQSTYLLSQMTSFYASIFKSVWKHPKLAPQQVLDALGPDATQLFTLGALLQATILEAKPDTILPSVPNQVTFNADGTVTVGDPIQTIDPTTGVDTNPSDTNPTLLSKLTSGIASIFSSFFGSKGS